MKKKKGKSKKHKKEVEDRAPTFDELFEATGGARLGMRARADQKGKLSRCEGLEGLEATDKQTISKTKKRKEPETVIEEADVDCASIDDTTNSVDIIDKKRKKKSKNLKRKDEK